MPRPKSDLVRMSFKFGEADRAALDRLAKDYEPANANEALRALIRAEIERRERKIRRKSG